MYRDSTKPTIRLRNVPYAAPHLLMDFGSFQYYGYFTYHMESFITISHLPPDGKNDFTIGIVPK